MPKRVIARYDCRTKLSLQHCEGEVCPHFIWYLNRKVNQTSRIFSFFSSDQFSFIWRLKDGFTNIRRSIHCD